MGMALDIENQRAERLARELARHRRQNVTDALLQALGDALKMEPVCIPPKGLAEELLAISNHYSNLPSLDERSDEEILGYGKKGFPN